MSRYDNARAALLCAQADASARVEIAASAIARVTISGVSWNDARTRAHRTAFAMAHADLVVATRALAALDQPDVEAGP